MQLNVPLIGVALCIRRDNKVLLHKRKGKHAPGSWVFTGGHLEKYEDFDQGRTPRKQPKKLQI